MAVYNPSLSHAVAITGNTSGALATVSTGTLVLAGGNNVTLSQNANSITVIAKDQSTQPVAYSVANGSANFSTLVFTNSNGVSFSSGTQGIYASVKTDYLTTARASNDGVGLNTAATNVTWTVNSSGISLNAGGYAGTGYTSTSQAGSTVGVTHNSAGLSMAWPPFLTAAAGGAKLILSNLGNTSGDTGNTNWQQVVVVGGNNVTLNASQGAAANSISATLSISVPNANQVLMATSTANAGGTSGTTNSYASGPMYLMAGNNMTLSQNSNSIVLSGMDNVFSASGGSSTYDVLSFSNSANAVTFSNSNGQVVLSHSLQQLSNTSAITASAVNTSQSSLFQQTSAMSNFAGISTGFSGTNISGSITHNSQGLALALSVNPGGAGGGVVVADGLGDTGTGGTIIFSNANGVSFNLATAANGSHTMFGSIDTAGGGAAVTFMTYQNRQLGASGSTQLTNNQIWMIPFRVAGGYVSASTIQYIQSLSGAYTSAAAATHAETMDWCIYSANPTNSSVFNSASSGSFTWQVWNSGTSSASYAYNGATSSSAGTGIMTRVAGVRMMNMPFGSSLAPGLYMMALVQSSSTAGYSGLLSRYGFVVDNPMPLAMGNGFGAATATSVGYVDAGTFSVTSTAFPSQVNISEVRQHSNLVPYFKIGAL